MRGIALVGAAVVVLLLTGCAASTTEVASPISTSASPTPTRSPSPTPTKTPAPPPSVKISCQDSNHQTIPAVTTMQQAWTSPVPVDECTASFTYGYVYSDLEKQAVQVAGYASLDSLDTLYALCASLQGSFYGQLPTYSAAQAAELSGAFTLCPDQPARPAIQARIDAVNQHTTELANGTRVGPGIHAIGSEMQSGTWAAENEVTDCYWEILDAAGEIIDNNFVTAALRVEVTIPEDAYSFNSSSCGEWTLQG